MIRLGLICIALLGLSACTVPFDHIVTSEAGSGPVKMSEQTFAEYQAYRKKAVPLVFALSEDGQQSYWYFCFSLDGDCDVEEYAQEAVYRCSIQGDRSPCHLFARRRAVVWNNPGDFSPDGGVS